ARLLERVPVLEDAPALRAQALAAVHAGAVTGRAAAALPVALGGLPPPAFHRGLREDDVLRDAPLAGGPAEDLPGRPREVAVAAAGPRLVPPAVTGRGTAA